MKNVIHKLVVLMVLTGVWGSSLAVFGQRKGGKAPGSGAAASAPAKCSAAWTGLVSYKRTQGMSDDKTEPRVSGRGEDTKSFRMKYDYKASVSVLEDPARPGSSKAKADINHTFSSIEKISATEKNSCDRGKTWRDMKGDSISKTETEATGQDDANVNVGVNADGTYTVSVATPQIKGKTSGEQKSSYSGQCTYKEGKTLTMPPTETTVDGNSLTSDGKDRVNPSDPYRLSGSYTHNWQGVSETITWNLEKCGAPLRIVDIKFEDMKFPNWNDWQEISEQVGTVDGNLVKIKAKVLNASGETKYGDVRFKETYKGDKWDGAKPDANLKDDVVSVSVEAGETKDVELMWDSSGYAWYDDGRPRLVQRIKAELEENGKKVDDETRNLKVAPKPLVLVHGLWSNWKAWETWQNILTTSHSYDWKAFPVGENAQHGEMNTGGEFLSTSRTNSIAQNARALQAYMKYAQMEKNAWHVDIVAHSMGGLISRYYIHNIMESDAGDGRPKVAHLIMLGTPNQGAPCADVMSTVFGILGKDVEAMRELTQESVRSLNGLVFNRRGVKFSALAGNPLPNTCKEVVWNDGVVTVASALYNVTDTGMSKSLHTDLTGTSDFSKFVKPRLAIGPKGNHMPAQPTLPSGFGSMDGAYKIPTGRTYGASGEPDSDLYPTPAEAPFAKAAKIGPGQSVVVDIPVAAAANLGVTFMADPKISAELLDAAGTKVGENLADAPTARAWFRSIFFERPTTAGTWKLKLTNTGEFEYEAIITTWQAGRP